jgi:hypothetical protein
MTTFILYQQWTIEEFDLISFSFFFFIIDPGVYSNGSFPFLLLIFDIHWLPVGVDFYINNVVQIITYKSKWLRAVCMNHSFTLNTSTSLPYSKNIYYSNIDELSFMDNCLAACIVYIYIYRHTLSFLLKTRVWLQLDAFTRIARREVHTFFYSLSICKKWPSNCSFFLICLIAWKRTRAGKCICLILSNS